MRTSAAGQVLDESRNVPFAQALTELKAHAGMSFRELSRALAETGPAMSPSHLSALANGVAHPSLSTMRRLAAVFGRPPTYFAEYRLAQVRALLDEGHELGLDGALAMIEALPLAVRLRALDQHPQDAPRTIPHRSQLP